jgi:hypothetical protein
VDGVGLKVLRGELFVVRSMPPSSVNSLSVGICVFLIHSESSAPTTVPGTRHCICIPTSAPREATWRLLGNPELIRDWLMGGRSSCVSPSARSSQVPTCCAGWRQQGDECGIGEWGIPGTWAGGSWEKVGRTRATAHPPFVRSGVRRQLHVFRERGVRAARGVPLPPRLLRCQLRH